MSEAMTIQHHATHGQPAVQLTLDNYADIAERIGIGLWGTPTNPRVAVRTTRGTVFARPGDWIVSTPQGYDVRPGNWETGHL